MKARKVVLVSAILLAAAATTGCNLTAPPTVQPPPTVAPDGGDVGLANPASVYCEEQGYTLEIRTDASGNQYGVCIFPDGSECEEWAFFRGECGPGEVETPTTSVNCDGVSLSYADALAAGVSCETVPVEELMGGVGFMPEHLELAFNNYVLPDTFHAPQIHIYPVSGLESGSEPARDIVTRLRQFLADRPAEPEEIPFLPLWNAGQLMQTQVAYLNFQNGSGVRFLSEYAQYYAPINNTDMFYTFQGLTVDGQYYIAAVLPVSHPTLPPDSSEIPGGDFDAFADNYLSYIADIEQQLAAADPASFAPSLALLDGMIQSISVAPTSPGQTGGMMQPLGDADCAALQADMRQVLGVEVARVVAPFSDPIGGQAGSGCQMTAEGTGADFPSFFAVAADLKALLVARGWQEDMMYQADGPTGTASGFHRGQALCLMSVMWTPAEDASCPADQPISACDLAPEQQLYTITLNCAQ